MSFSTYRSRSRANTTSPKRAETSPASSGTSAGGSTKTKRLIEAIAACCGPRPQNNWLARLSPDDRKEIEGIKAAWRAGELDASARRLAEVLVAACREHGIPICGPDGVRLWLSKD